MHVSRRLALGFSHRYVEGDLIARVAREIPMHPRTPFIAYTSRSSKDPSGIIA